MMLMVLLENIANVLLVVMIQQIIQICFLRINRILVHRHQMIVWNQHLIVVHSIRRKHWQTMQHQKLKIKTELQVLVISFFLAFFQMILGGSWTQLE